MALLQSTMSSMANLAPNNMSHEVPSSKSSGLPSNSYYGASLNNISMSSQINSHINKQQTAAQSYISAASIFKTMEENISKNVLNMIGVQKNKNNMMAATICNVIDSVMANTYNIFNKKVHNLADSINNNNNIMLNNINEIIGKNNKNMIHHINNLINKMDDRFKLELNHINESMNKMVKKIDGMNIKIMSEEEEKESLVEILLNDIDIVKSKINLYEINNNKFNELINESKKLEKNIEKKENKMAEIINNKFGKIENIINNKKNSPSKVMVNKLDEMNKEILNIKNKLNNDMKKIENMNKNMVNIKNQCEASTFSNDGALQQMVKKLDNNNKTKKPSSIKDKKRKINDKYKKKKKNINNHKNKNKNKNKKINNKNNNNKWNDPALIRDKNTISTSSLDHNNNNKVDTIWGQTFDPIIIRNKELYGDTNKDEHAIEFYIECSTFRADKEYGPLTKGNIVCINMKNIKNIDNGDFKLYAIIKWHDKLIKKYLIPDRGKDTTSTDVKRFVLDRIPDGDETDIYYLNIKGKTMDNNICLNKL